MRRGTAATTWYERGVALEPGDPRAAIGCYQRAVAGRPDLADAHNNLGRLLHDAGDPVAAEGHYRLALCAAPRVALYWFNLGVAVEDRGRSAEAIAAYEQAVACAAPGAEIAEAHFNLARLLEVSARRAGDQLLLRRAVGHLSRYRRLGRSAR